MKIFVIVRYQFGLKDHLMCLQMVSAYPDKVMIIVYT